MIKVNAGQKSLNVNEKQALKPMTKDDKSICLFSDKSEKQVGDSFNLSSLVLPPPDKKNDTIIVPKTDTIKSRTNLHEVAVVEFYSNGRAHYVNDYVDNVLVKRTEYMGDGNVIAYDEYSDGIIQRHVENYPGSGEVWTVLEYKDGKPSEIWEYTPDGRCCTYKDLTKE